MKNVLISAAIGGFALLQTTATALADPFAGPHEVYLYKQSRYIFVDTGSGNYTNLRVYRARGPGLWQKWGATSITKGQRTSNGSIRQNIYYNGRVIGIKKIDLKNKANIFIPGRR